MIHTLMQGRTREFWKGGGSVMNNQQGGCVEAFGGPACALDDTLYNVGCC